MTRDDVLEFVPLMLSSRTRMRVHPAFKTLYLTLIERLVNLKLIIIIK